MTPEQAWEVFDAECRRLKLGRCPDVHKPEERAAAHAVAKAERARIVAQLRQEAVGWVDDLGRDALNAAADELEASK